MKKIVIAFLLTAAMIMTGTVSAFADTAVTGSIRLEGNSVSVSARCESRPAQVFAIMCAKIGKDDAPSAQKLLAADKKLVAYNHLATDSDGNLSYSFDFSEDDENGKYTLLVTDGSVSYYDTIFRVDEKIALKKIKELNLLKTAKEYENGLAKALEDEILPIDTEKYVLEGDTVAFISKELFEKKVSSLSDFTDCFNGAYFVYEFKTSDRSGLFEMLENTPECIKIDKTLAKKLSAKQKILFLDLTEKESINSISDFEKNYEENYILAVASAPSNYADIKNLITGFDIIGANLGGDYAKLSNSTAVYKSMVGATYNSLEDIRTAFNKGVANELKTENSANTSSKGGGGSLGAASGASSPVATPLPKTPSFSDIEDYPWAEKEIKALASCGAIAGDGDGHFNPDKNITRSEFIKMTVSAFGLLVKSENPGFEDVIESDWEYDYVASGVKLGIINGVTNKKFCGKDFISREDAALILSRLAGKIGISLGKGENSSFSDSADISDYAKDAVLAMSNAGLVKGSDGKFLPKEKITRAECAVLLARLLERAGD